MTQIFDVCFSTMDSYIHIEHDLTFIIVNGIGEVFINVEWIRFECNIESGWFRGKIDFIFPFLFQFHFNNLTVFNSVMFWIQSEKRWAAQIWHFTCIPPVAIYFNQYKRGSSIENKNWIFCLLFKNAKPLNQQKPNVRQQWIGRSQIPLRCSEQKNRFDIDSNTMIRVRYIFRCKHKCFSAFVSGRENILLKIYSTKCEMLNIHLSMNGKYAFNASNQREKKKSWIVFLEIDKAHKSK